MSIDPYFTDVPIEKLFAKITSAIFNKVYDQQIHIRPFQVIDVQLFRSTSIWHLNQQSSKDSISSNFKANPFDLT